MIHRHFNVLLVDDDDDVLAVSRLALRRISVYGLPLRVHTARSRDEAQRFFAEHPEGSHVALALVDVVMETDHAGLELCGWLREERDNHITPLVVRTGQAGKAPEREVIDRYEITGFVNKVEANEARLYSLVKGSVRQYVMAAYEHAAGGLLYYLISNLRSAARARKAVQIGLDALSRAPSGARLESMHESHAVLSDRFYAGSGELDDAARGRALREHLLAEEGTLLSPGGDRMVVSDGRMLLHVEGTNDHPMGLDSLWSIEVAPPPFLAKTLYMATRQMQVLLNLLER